LNVALFGITAAEWRGEYPDRNGNVRDYADVAQLICLSNLESLNSVLIQDGLSQSERLAKLNAVAIYQMKKLVADVRVARLDSASRMLGEPTK
jgi:hypothetical protein